MEGKISKSVLIALLVMGVLIGETKATSFKECYVGCFALCAVSGGKLIDCGFKCLKQCIIPSPSEKSSSLESGKEENTEYFCKLGCASSLCTNFSSRENPAAEKVEGCVNSCSKTCAKY